MQQIESRQFNALIKLTRVESKPLKRALKEHLTKGSRQCDVAKKHGVDKAHLSRAIKRLKLQLSLSKKVFS